MGVDSQKMRREQVSTKLPHLAEPSVTSSRDLQAKSPKTAWERDQKKAVLYTAPPILLDSGKKKVLDCGKNHFGKKKSVTLLSHFVTLPESGGPPVTLKILSFIVISTIWARTS